LPQGRGACASCPWTFRPNLKLDTAKVIMELGKGEALVSFLEGNGTPSMVERCMVRPPSARLGTITPDERKALMAESPVKGKYDQAVDSDSAYDLLQKRLQESSSVAPPRFRERDGVGFTAACLLGPKRRPVEEFPAGVSPPVRACALAHIVTTHFSTLRVSGAAGIL
jgi:Bacterial protein of unknown function (DUF853)